MPSRCWLLHMHLWCAEGMDWTPNLCPFGLEDSHCDLTPDSSVTKWAAVTLGGIILPGLLGSSSSLLDRLGSAN